MGHDPNALIAEEKKLRTLRRLVDLTTALLYQSNLSLDEAQRLVAACRQRALELFPDKGETYELIYGTRFQRILIERFHLQ
jgi:hypothetical protein